MYNPSEMTGQSQRIVRFKMSPHLLFLFISISLDQFSLWNIAFPVCPQATVQVIFTCSCYIWFSILGEVVSTHTNQVETFEDGLLLGHNTIFDLQILQKLYSMQTKVCRFILPGGLKLKKYRFCHKMLSWRVSVTTFWRLCDICLTFSNNCSHQML